MQNTRVRNLFSTILGVGVVAGGLVLSSCEDEFTEQDAIRAQQETLAALEDQEANNDAMAQAMQDSLDRIGAKIDYTVTVAAAGQANTGRTSAEASAEGATVTLVQGGKTYTETAGKGGVATFAGLSRGQAVVTVEATDHTAVTYTTTLGFSASGTAGKENYNVGTLIPVFPTTVAAGATEIKGKAWAELDATNDMPEAAQGAMVRGTLDVSTVLTSYRKGTTSFGNVETATYEGFSKEATVGEDGTYSLIVPNGKGSNGNGFAPTVKFMPFVAKQKYVELQDGKLVTMEKDVLFGGDGDDGEHLIEDLPGVYVEIEAPTAKAEGFVPKAELVKQDLFLNDFEAIKGGSGYKVNDVFELSADGDNVATITVTSVDETTGAIDQFTYAGNSAMFAEKPAITAKTVSGTGAEFSVDFVNLYQIVVDNPGTGYWTEPLVTMVYTNENGQQRVADFYNIDVEDGKVGEKGDVLRFDARTASGSYVDDYTTFFSTTVPTPKAFIPEPKQAVIDPRLIMIEDGFVYGIDNGFGSRGLVFGPGYDISSMFDGGFGYITVPKVTFKTAGGNGTGAEGEALLEDGRVVGIAITNPGSGYGEANDTDHDMFNNISFDQTIDKDDDIITPGSSNPGINFNYGAGMVQ